VQEEKRLKLFALDTATEIGGVALLEGSLLRGEARIRVDKTHASQLWKTIYDLLAQTGWTLADIDGWAVTIGPGSFTGLRIGLATIKGLALATRKPVIGISTLDVLAGTFPYSPHLICPTIDARKKEVFCAFYRSNSQGKVEQVGEPRNIKPGILAEEINEPVLLVGSGARLYADLFREKLGDLALIPEAHLHLLSPYAVGLMAFERFQLGVKPSLEEIRPLYIRPSDAELGIKGLKPSLTP
jgi:tRNA threonylcarbamoyladenosine biosynthesis protein TsaB